MADRAGFGDRTRCIAENEIAVALAHPHPEAPGHSLIVLRRPVASWWETTPVEQLGLFELANTVRQLLDQEMELHGCTLTVGHQAIDGLDGRVVLELIPDLGGSLFQQSSGTLFGEPVHHMDPDRCAPAGAESHLVTPADGQLKLEILRCLISPAYDRVDLLVSFIMRSGIDLIARHVDEALENGVHFRILTTDYLGVTDTGALGFFLDRVGEHGAGRLDLRVFSDPATSFHPKAYLFTSSDTGDGVAFVGSSNMSRSGITSGVEWNIRTGDVAGLLIEFEHLWNDPRSVSITNEWLDAYDRSRPDHGLPAPGRCGDDQGSPGSDPEMVAAAEVGEDAEVVPQPWSVQSEALAALEATRVDGHRAGLVVMATGLGKTWLAAFDSTRPEFRRVLFVAHRAEILAQARDTYRRIRPSGRFGLFVGDERTTLGDVIFASVQSLHRHLENFDADAFDYIVVDEFHHAAAASYRKVIAHFRPRFLLGLTATPDRSDAADLLALCSDNLVYDCGLVEGVGRGLLSPFIYRAIPDVADYAEIPWRSGRFDAEALTRELSTQQRADQVLDQWRRLGGVERRTLAFCSTIAHADFMAEWFRSEGIEAVAVHSGPRTAARIESLERLAGGELPIIFTVDLFNEGVDVPSIDLVLLLRPTESPVVFIQQLGRGLRRLDGKSHLDVVDLVGNHRSFLLKARILAALVGRPYLTNREALEFLRDGRVDLAEGGMGLPEGCSIIVEPDVIDMLGELLGRMKDSDRLTQLARAWVDDHEGARPTALELSILFGKGFSLKSSGGWFGFLADIGLLNDEELRVVERFGDFLTWIEYGSHPTGAKLVALRTLAVTGRLRAGMGAVELATLSRWYVLDEAVLRAELATAADSIADPGSPRPDEWLTYWRTNAVAEMLRAQKGSSPWFVDDDDVIRFATRVETGLGESFDRMVSEIVEYRLHRYLVTAEAKRVGESRKFQRGGVEVDATFTVESNDHQPTSIVIESAGGARDTAEVRNPDFVDGVDLLLERLRVAGIPILDVYVDTARTGHLTVADRRIEPEGLNYPLDLAEVGDLKELRKQLLRSMAQVGRGPGLKSGGNPRRRTRFVIAAPQGWNPGDFADALANDTLIRHPANNALRLRSQ